MTGSNPENQSRSPRDIVDGIIDVSKAAEDIANAIAATPDEAERDMLMRVAQTRIKNAGLEIDSGDSSPTQEKTGTLTEFTRREILSMRRVRNPYVLRELGHTVRKRIDELQSTDSTDPENPVN